MSSSDMHQYTPLLHFLTLLPIFTDKLSWSPFTFQIQRMSQFMTTRPLHESATGQFTVNFIQIFYSEESCLNYCSPTSVSLLAFGEKQPLQPENGHFFGLNSHSK